MEIDVHHIFGGLIDALRGPVGLAFSLTLLGAIAIGALKQRKKNIDDIRRDPPIGPTPPRDNSIPVVQHDPDQVDRAAVMNRISHLVVSGEWRLLAKEIAKWENRLEAAPGGERYHDIGVETCLTGLRTLLDDAPRDNLDSLASAEREIERFVDRHANDPEDHILAVLAARAHLMMAQTCDAEFWPSSERKPAWRQMAHHYLRAEAVLAPFDPVAHMSPLLAEAYYQLAIGMPDGGGRQTPAFEDWIDLDPSNPKIYAAHIPNILAKDPGNFELVLEESERATERTLETLGQGGFVLCVLPAIAETPEIREVIAADKLAGGLMDLARSSATQAEVNWAAAVLAEEAEHGSDERKEVFRCAFDALVKRNLTVIYPRLWHIDLDSIRALIRQTQERAGTVASSESLYSIGEAQAA